jgi:hypothetical protein
METIYSVAVVKLYTVRLKLDTILYRQYDSKLQYYYLEELLYSAEVDIAIV